MFKQHTVFIVGAGASSECGLPTGDQLKNAITEGIGFRYESGSLVKGDSALLDMLRGRHPDPEPHIRAGLELAPTIKTFPSIDEALHWWRVRSEIVELGKLAIAHYILDSERRSFLSRQRGEINIAAADSTWLSSFISMALSGLERDQAQRAFDAVTVINFNYDRTIEHYLYCALQQHAGISTDQAAACVAGLQIIRPYGSIGKLEWQDSAGVPFGGNNHPQEVTAAVNNLRTFTEQISEETLLPSIDAVLDAAHLVIFLGFGFHQQNMKLFKPLTLGTRRPNVLAIMATTKGIDDKNHPAIRDNLYFLGLTPSPPVPTLVACKAAELLVQLRPTITMTAA